MTSDQVVAPFSNGTIIIKENGKYKKIIPVANTGNQTMPLDVEDDVAAGVPRDKSVGMDQTETDYTEYSHEYKMGDDGSDTDVVPRSSGNSGIDGWEKPDFAEEIALDATSGNPDTYFQKFTPSEKPTKAGDKNNHTASLEEENAMLKKALAEKDKELTREKVLRKREIVARKIVDLEITAGLTQIETEDEINHLIESKLDTPTEILENDLNRLKSLCSMIDSGKIVSTSSQQLPKIKSEQTSLQSLFNYGPLISTAKQENVIPSISNGTPAGIQNNKFNDLGNKIKNTTTLGRKFKN